MRNAGSLEFCGEARIGHERDAAHGSCLTRDMLPNRTSPAGAACGCGSAGPSLAALARDERGAQMVEYIILVGVIAIAALAGFKTFGSQVRAKVDQQADTVQVIQGQ
jgi:Flp pilus assembly pilin Flp